jgi:hypothetical protein
MLSLLSDTDARKYNLTRLMLEKLFSADANKTEKKLKVNDKIATIEEKLQRCCKQTLPPLDMYRVSYSL